MGAENSDSNINDVYNRPRRNSAKLNEIPNLPVLRRHENTRGTAETSLNCNNGFNPKNTCPQRFTRRASENYCIDFRSKYANGGLQNAVLRKFSENVQNP